MTFSNKKFHFMDQNGEFFQKSTIFTKELVTETLDITENIRL